VLRYSLKGLWAHKRRFVSTFVSILLGVSFVTGAMVLGDTLAKAFDDLFADATAGTDAFVRSESTVEDPFVGDPQRGRVDVALTETVAGVDGVAAAEPYIQTSIQMAGADGEPVRDPGFDAPTFGGNWLENDDLNAFDLAEGRAPSEDREVAIDRRSAREGELGLDGRTQVVTPQGTVEVTVVGITTFAGQDSPGGAGFVLFTTEAAEELLSGPGQADGIAAVAEAGVSQQDLVDRIGAELPDGVEVITGDRLTEENQSSIREQIRFITLVPLIFALVALVTGAFMIANTFSILVAQRARELALLRAVGGSRGQVMRAVLTEAVALALAASAAGIAFGLVVAIGLRQFFGRGSLPTTGLVLTPVTVIVSLLVGVAITAVSSVVPAWKASRVPPIAALRDVAVEDARSSRGRVVLGAIVTAAGAIGVLWAVFAGGEQAWVLAVVGALSVLLGTLLLGPLLARHLGRLLGAPLPRIGGVPGNLARRNALRSPRRTAATAAALLVGVGVVGFVVVLASSLKESINDAVDRAFAGDLMVDSGTFGAGGFSPDVARRIADEPDVEGAAGIRFAPVEVDGRSLFVVAVDPESVEQVMDIGVTAGSLADLGESQVAVWTEAAEENGWALGDEIEMRFSQTGPQTFTVAALFDRQELLGPIVVGFPAWEANVTEQFDTQIFVNLADGADPDEAAATIAGIVADYPAAEVLDASGLKEQVAAQVDTLLRLVFVLLSMALLIALLGIANALSLAVHERTRELGLLRAVGMTRPQMRRMVRWEAAVVAVLGTLIGLAVGVFFGWSLVKALADQGVNRFAVGAGLLVLVVAAAALAGILAALRPAYRAAKLNVLAAIAYE
jgi:putative ABC transport system permease protein